LLALRNDGEKVDNAFIRWYLDVRLGPSRPELRITDGPRDGGIDAIWYPGTFSDEVHIVQSFYTTNGTKKSAPRKKVAEFLDLPEHFGVPPKAFSIWLEGRKVRTDLHGIYHDLNDKIRRQKWQPVWLFLTSARSTAQARALITSARKRGDQAILAAQADVSRAYALYLEGAAPPDKPLEFRHQGDTLTYQPKGLPRVKVFAARLDDLLAYVEQDRTLRLFSRNVRLLVRGAPANRKLLETYRESPQELFLGHNGITVICSKIDPGSREGFVRLSEPNVVNGAQTLLTLRNQGRSARAVVLAKVIEIEDYKKAAETVQEIAVRTNSQTAVTPQDLISCDERQVEIERYFRRKRRIYIRRRGQELLEMGPRAGLRMTSTRLAQVLACCSARDGVVIAGRKKADLFEGERYERLFWEQPISSIFAQQLVWELVEEARKNSHARKRNKYRYASRNVLAAIWLVVDADRQIRTALTRGALLNSVEDSSAYSSDVPQLVQKMFETAWSRYRTATHRNPDLSPAHFFFGDVERADQLNRALANRYRKRLLKLLR